MGRCRFVRRWWPSSESRCRARRRLGGVRHDLGANEAHERLETMRKLDHRVLEVRLERADNRRGLIFELLLREGVERDADLGSLAQRPSSGVP
jgi:hypothetical protein